MFKVGQIVRNVNTNRFFLLTQCLNGLDGYTVTPIDGPNKGREYKVRPNVEALNFEVTGNNFKPRDRGHV